jgi:hypothetical protein
VDDLDDDFEDAGVGTSLLPSMGSGVFIWMLSICRPEGDISAHVADGLSDATFGVTGGSVERTFVVVLFLFGEVARSGRDISSAPVVCFKI